MVADLGWVDYDLGHSIVCLLLLGQMGVWQNRLVKMEYPNKNQANPTQVLDHQSHPVYKLALEASNAEFKDLRECGEVGPVLALNNTRGKTCSVKKMENNTVADFSVVSV